jgi:hypothetical protein
MISLDLECPICRASTFYAIAYMAYSFLLPFLVGASSYLITLISLLNMLLFVLLLLLLLSVFRKVYSKKLYPFFDIISILLLTSASNFLS